MVIVTLMKKKFVETSEYHWIEEKMRCWSLVSDCTLYLVAGGD